MVSILIITLISFAAFILLTGLGLMKDFSRLWIRNSRKVFAGRQGTKYYCQLAVTLSVTLLIAIAAEASKWASTALMALVTTSDIPTFTTALRGIFSAYTTEIQHPKNHILMFILNPGLKAIAILVLTNGIEQFCNYINKKTRYDCYDQADILYFGSIGTLFLIGIEMLCHSQDIKLANMAGNTAYILMDELSYILIFLSLAEAKMLYTHRAQLEQAINKYLITNSFEKSLLLSPWKMAIAVYFMGLLLALPSFLGLQFIRSNVALFSVFIIVAGVALLLLKLVFADAYNLLGTVVFSKSTAIPLDTPKAIDPKTKRTRKVALVAAGVVLLAFAIAFTKHMFMLLVILGIAAFLSALVVTLAFFLTMGISRLINLITGNQATAPSMGNSVSYLGWGLASLPKVAGKAVAIVVLAFMAMTCFPKDIDLDSIYANCSVVDTNGDVLYVDMEQNFHYVPLKFEEIPDFTIQCIVNQEDRSFFLQREWMPNTSNWHGISISMLKGRGGSNINSQVIKNLAFLDAPGIPRDLNRKITDQAGAFMLSIRKTPQEIITAYINLVCFHGSFGGFKGLNASSLYAFGKPAKDLNKIQSLYLVQTLPKAGYIIGKKGKIAYNDVQNDSTGIIKDVLLAKAERWMNEGLLSRKDYNTIRRESLDFTNRRYKNDIATGTRCRIEKSMGSPGRHLSYITLKNEQSMARAYENLRNHQVFHRNGAELMVACLAIDVHTGHIIGHYSSEMADYTDYRDGFDIGSIAKPAIVTEMLAMGASPNLTLYDGKRNGRKTPKNANHGWSNKYLGINEILSKSLNAPFVNIQDLGLNPRQVFLNTENSYRRMGIRSDEHHLEMCNDTYNYPLGIRQLQVVEVGQLYQVLMNDGLCLRLQDHETGDTIVPTRIYDAQHVAVVKEALSRTITSGTMKIHRDKLPQGRTYYAKTGTATKNKCGWAVISDGHLLVVTLASYARCQDGTIQFGVEPLYGGSSAGVMSVLVYNELRP